MADDKKDEVVTMLDVLNEERGKISKLQAIVFFIAYSFSLSLSLCSLEMDEASNAVFGGSDETKCTHLDGYIKRQALYSCLTCTPEAKTDPSKAIGCCLGCSLSCHDSHELVELYTKRLFRCDCGVKKGSVKCQLDFSKKFPNAEASGSSSSSNRDQPNIRNKYNQNFSGSYCICNRPYPDEEDPIEDVMIQCVACENWFHSRHLGDGKSKTPDPSCYSDVTCDSCMSEHEFLQDYIGLAIETLDPEESRNDSTLNVTSLDDSMATAEESEPKKIKLADDACVRPKVTLSGEKSGNAAFWKKGWRQSLCKCPKCIKMYEKSGVEYLVDEEDTVQFYEAQGKSKRQHSTYGSSLEALSNLPHVNQVDAITSYNRMKEKLFEYLQTFVTNNTIVTDEDIKRFFNSMKESDSQSSGSNAHQQNFCR
jgi:E3 ubiquitin-protein ligase UBR7